MQEKFKGKYRTDSVRLKYWDYSWDGWYFITICVKNHECVFGNIVDGEMVLNHMGKVVHQFWSKIPEHFANMELDEFIVMPNHLHGVLVLKNNSLRRDTPWRVSNKKTKFGNVPKNSLPIIINHFKGAVTRWCRKNGYINFQWQPKYYDHIIRNEKSLENIRNYIHLNAQKWHDDQENPLFMKL